MTKLTLPSALIAFCLLVVGASLSWLAAQDSSAVAGTNGGKYSVISTDAAHVIVTDNTTHVVFFYTVGEGGSPGDDLQLRGSIDLSQVGKPVMKVKRAQN